MTSTSITTNGCRVCGGMHVFLVLSVLGLVTVPPAASQTPAVDPPAELEMWTLLAGEGDADAQFNLGLMHMGGASAPEPGYERAAHWFEQAAQQGHTGAQYRLGSLYINGHGVAQDPHKAVYWWRQAAENDHTLAQRNLAHAYISGVGVPRDESRAMHWFQRAARAGDWYSIEMLRSAGRSGTAPPDPELIGELHRPVDIDVSEARAPHSATEQPGQVDTAQVATPITAPGPGRTPIAESHDAAAPGADRATGADAVLAEKPGLATSPRTDDTTAGDAHVRSSAKADAADDLPATPVGDDQDPAATVGLRAAAAGAPTARGAEADAVGSAAARAEPDSLSTGEPPTKSPADDRRRTMDADNDLWLFAKSQSGYTIQLISSRQRKLVERFARRDGVREHGRIFETLINDEPWWYLVYGAYAKREHAVAAVKSLGLDLEQVWIRSFEVLQKNRCQGLSAAARAISAELKTACAGLRLR